ncbi:MAG: carbon-nitrogen hydrolase family protein [Planctomycetes bacterium]|nr:carbon-nitrogen hydrolase family protein [Planctomycetota bacterium]
MLTKYPRVALLVNPVTANAESNLATAVKMIHEAAGNGSDLVLLGEMAVTGMLNNDNPVHDLPLSESIPGLITTQLSETAEELGIWLGTGLLERDGARLYDTAVLFSPKGDIRLKYRRVQPMWHGRHADPTVYCQGTELFAAETNYGKMAFMICGDLFDDCLRRRMQDMHPDWLLHLYARCFPDGSRDQNRWTKNEIPEYAKQVSEIGVPMFSTSYVCIERFSQEADAFGGAMVIDRDGVVIDTYPLDKSGILYIDSEKIPRGNLKTHFH